jgi:hypothetical protein
MLANDERMAIRQGRNIGGSKSSDNDFFSIKHKHISLLFCLIGMVLALILYNPFKPLDPILEYSNEHIWTYFAENLNDLTLQSLPVGEGIDDTDISIARNQSGSGRGSMIQTFRPPSRFQDRYRMCLFEGWQPKEGMQEMYVQLDPYQIPAKQNDLSSRNGQLTDSHLS